MRSEERKQENEASSLSSTLDKNKKKNGDVRTEPKNDDDQTPKKKKKKKKSISSSSSSSSSQVPMMRHEFNWKPVQVSFPGEVVMEESQEEEQQQHTKSSSTTSTGSSSTTRWNKKKKNHMNHYDNPSMEKVATFELEAMSNEPTGIFFGLEVLDGNSYQIQENSTTKQKIMIPMNHSYHHDHHHHHDDDKINNKKNNNSTVVEGVGEASSSSSLGGNQTKSKQEISITTTTTTPTTTATPIKKASSQEEDNDDMDHVATTNKKKKTKKRKRRRANGSNSSNSHENDGQDDQGTRHDDDCFNMEEDEEESQKKEIGVVVSESSSQQGRDDDDDDNVRKETRRWHHNDDDKTKLTKKSTNNGKKTKSNNKNEKKNNKNTSRSHNNNNDDETRHKEEEEVRKNEEKIRNLQTSWSIQTGGVALHPKLCQALVQQNFWVPTPIQSSALPAAILGRRNIVGAAPTGSGKTLAFLLPIGQSLLLEHENNKNNSTNPDMEQKKNKKNNSRHVPTKEKNNNNSIAFISSSLLQALILTPTRELALQIQMESDKLLGCGQTGTLVGGLAHVKQIRIIEKKRPPIIVATPGRLWEMMSSREYSHLNNLSQIRYLVIDEADRMIQQGSFPQLAMILDAVQRANPNDDEEDDYEDHERLDGDENMMDKDRLLGLPGVPGEAKLMMLNDDVLAEIERQRKMGEVGSQEPDVKEVDDGEYEAQTGVAAGETENDDDGGGGGGDPDDELDEELLLPTRPPVHRQTFVYSATLTLPTASSSNFKSKRSRFVVDVDVDGAIAEILEKSRAKGKTKVIDLSNMNNKKTRNVSKQQTETRISAESQSDSGDYGAFRLPDGLSLQEIKCTQRHKDSHLYAYLMTTVEGSSGPCLVFCNSIACVRRVGTTLQALGLDVRILHAKMQQRARFKAVELLHDSMKRTVVVATDVAARGLDIPSVASVVHYDTARTVDGFVHRAGRTARGVGPKAVGCSVSMVAPDEDKMHAGVSRALNIRFEPVVMDGRLLKEAQERVNLACKVAEVSNLEQKCQRQNQWIKGKADEAGLEVDDDVLVEGMSGGDWRDRSKLQEAQRAQKRLAQLLMEPMKIQRYGKFLSTNATLKQEIMLQTPNSYQMQTPRARSRKRRRRR